MGRHARPSVARPRPAPLRPRPGGDRVRVTAVIPTNRGTPLGLGALRAQDCALDVLVLTNGDRIHVADTVDEVVDQAIAFLTRVQAGALTLVQRQDDPDS